MMLASNVARTELQAMQVGSRYTHIVHHIPLFTWRSVYLVLWSKEKEAEGIAMSESSGANMTGIRPRVRGRTFSK